MMRFQILVLAAALATSVLVGYTVSETPASSPARPDSFAANNGVGEGAVAIFTEFGNEMAWEDRALADSRMLASSCAEPSNPAGGSGGQLEGLVHRISQSGALAEGRIKTDTGCE
jgi:hypothetical protein